MTRRVRANQSCRGQKSKVTRTFVVVVGIGGSYLGARAAIEMLQHSFFTTYCRKEKRNAPQVFFAGHNISSTYLNELLSSARRKRRVENVILEIMGRRQNRLSPSGVLKQFMEEKYGQEGARARIYATRTVPVAH